MEISTFKDENYNLDDRIAVFEYTLFKDSIKLTDCVSCEKYNPNKLLEISKKIEKEKAQFEKLFDTTISDEEFFRAYKNFYRWNCDAIIANLNLDTFVNPKRLVIKTNDAVKNIKSKGHGENFFWWTVWHNSVYIVLTDADFELEDRIYTKEEIAKLVQEKKMVVLRNDIPYGNELNSEEAYETNKKLKTFEVNPVELSPEFGRLGYAINDEDIKLMILSNPLAIPAIRKDLTQERISKDYQRYLVEYDRTMSQIDMFLQEFLNDIEEPKTKKLINEINGYFKSKKQSNIMENSTKSEQLTTDAEMTTND